jgi:hypothetical protein
MRETTSVEGPDATLRPRMPRMEAAKGALRSMLEELAERGNARVGVRLFGHRVGWSTVEDGKLLRQTGYAGEIPAELRPYADVEAILPLGRFDSVVAGTVADRLKTVQPWGETPVYLALTQALADFTDEDEGERTVVVITDGMNYQFNPPAEFARTKDDVLAAARRAKAAVYIVGFDIPQGEAEAARRDFQEVASATGGAFLPAAGASAFADALETLLRPGEFRVSSPDGQTVDKAELGQSVTLPRPAGPQEYVVGFQSLMEPIELFGGEGVELAYRPGDRRLEVVPYLKGNPRSENLVAQDDGATTLLKAFVHRSTRSQRGVTFPISIENSAGHFVPRPMELWVVITPQASPPRGDATTYLFYDAPFEPGTSVPLCQFVARDWPLDCPRAEVRLWAKPIATTPTE